MTAYNSESHIYSAINSILFQTYENFELIIIDDESGDSTLSIIKQFNDKRIQYYSNKHSGPAIQRNFGLSLAKGDFINFMDSDDIIDKCKFEKQIKFIEENDDIDVLGTNCYMINENGDIFFKKEYPERHEKIEYEMPIFCSILNPSALIRRDKIVFIGGLLNQYGPSLDFEMYLRLLISGCKFHNLQEPLHFYRKWKNSYTVTENRMCNDNFYKYAKSYINFTHKDLNYDYYYKIALLEYYRGSIKVARWNFAVCLSFNSKFIFKLFRYIPLLLFGDKLTKIIRKFGITAKLNYYIYRYFKVDTNRV